MPIDGDSGEDPPPSETAAVELRRRIPGEGAEGRLGQLMESNGLKNSGLFGLVQYFMDRPENQSQSSGSSSPRTMLTSVVTTPAAEPATLPSTESFAPLDSSSSLTDGPELVKNEVFSDGDKSGPLQPQSQQRLEAQQSQNTRTYLKSEEYRQLFHLPPEEVLIEDFNCALQKKILLQGHMYLFDQYVCFYSNIFGYEKKKVIPLKDVTCVRKAKTAGVFPNAIEITGWGKKHFFASFLSRDEAFRLIVNGWAQHSGYARKFLGNNFSPVSSPPSQGRVSIDSASMSLPWRSPQRAASLPIDGTYSPRDVEDVPNLVAPSVLEEPREEVRERRESEGTSEPANVSDAGDGGSEEIVVVSRRSSVPPPTTSTCWEPEDLDAPVVPEGYKTVVESEFAVDVEEFFQVYFSDNAIGFLKQFHSKCGDDDFRCTEWAKHRHFGRARDISFRHPINFYFGPKATYCHESQRYRIYRNSHLVLETSQQMTDIPYGDYFRVEVRWDVEKLSGRGSNHCFVRVSLGVSFCKKTVWKGKIEQGTFDESKEAYTTWIREAHALLRNMRAVDTNGSINGDPAALPSPEARETPGEAADIVNGAILTEDESRDRRAHDVEQTIKTAPVVDEFRTKELDTGRLRVYGRDWTKKSSAALGTMLLVSQRIWEKGYNLDFKANKQLKLLCFILIAFIVVLMQIGIILVLARTPKLQYVPVGYQNPQVSGRSCFGELTGDDALAWLEQRTRNIKQEIILSESRLQTLHQDLTILKMHASNLLGFVDVKTSQRSSSE